MDKSSDLPETLTRRELSNLLKRFTPVSSVQELVEWFEDGRRHLLRDIGAAASELGAPEALLRAVVASTNFRQAYFDHLHKRAFNPDVLERGMGLLAQDFIDANVSVRDRLAIFRMLQELFGITPTQKVQHEISQRVAHIHIKVESTPADFVDVDAHLVGEGEGQLGPGDGGVPGGVPEERGALQVGERD